jgi:8-oxo-dGTP diphosphatase
MSQVVVAPTVAGRHASVVDVHLVLVRDGRLLWARRANTGYMDGLFEVVAGHLEAGEDVVAATIREAREEVGIDLRRENLECVHVMHRLTPEGLSRIGFFFRATRWDGEVVNAEPHKCSELLWSPVDVPPTGVVPYLPGAVCAIVNGESFSLYGWSG